MFALAWFIAALVLAGLELLAGEFTLLMLAGGALAASGVAALTTPLWPSVAAFAVASIGLLFFVRPYLRRRLTTPNQIENGAGELVGKPAVVLEAIEAHGHRPGQIRVNGEVWTATALDPQQSFATGERVTVVSISDNTAVVWSQGSEIQRGLTD